MSLSTAKKHERRRFFRVHKLQLQRAKSALTICFLGLLLATACAPLRQTLSGMEVYIFTMLAAYGCLRHSHICASQPLLCRAMLSKAMRLLLLGFLVEGWRVVRDRDMLLRDWSVLSLTEKISFASSTSDVLLLLVLLYALLRLLPTLQDADTSGVARRLWLSRTRRAAFASFGLAMGVASHRREPDCAVLALALFATTEDVEGPRVVQNPAVVMAGGGAGRVGGLLTAVLLCGLTAVADLCALSAPLRADGSLLASAEPSLLLLKLVAKGAFGGCAVRLLNVRRPPSQHELVASVQEGGNLLHKASALLLGTVCLVSTAHTLSADVWFVQWFSAYPLASLDAADADAIAIAVGLAAGPTAALAVAGCGVALGNGGRQGSVLVLASSFVLLLVDATWLWAGPLSLRWGDFAPLGSGALPDRWQARCAARDHPALGPAHVPTWLPAHQLSQPRPPTPASLRLCLPTCVHPIRCCGVAGFAAAADGCSLNHSAAAAAQARHLHRHFASPAGPVNILRRAHAPSDPGRPRAH